MCLCVYEEVDGVYVFVCLEEEKSGFILKHTVAPRCHRPQVPTSFMADIDRQQRKIANVNLSFSKGK